VEVKQKKTKALVYRCKWGTEEVRRTLIKKEKDSRARKPIAQLCL
jgi:hypothetical protein